ncbi:hypothetical protein CR513_01183, partial [Mucuna pruriens]
MQVGQLANVVSLMQSVGSRNIPSQTIPNLKGGVSVVTLRSEINIPLLDAIKQIPKYAKFLKELCLHKRKKLKGVEMGGVVSKLIKSEDVTARSQQVLPKKC